MDQHQLARCTQLATELCNRVNACVAELGLYNALITAIWHQGTMVQVHLEVRDGFPAADRQTIELCQTISLNEAQQFLKTGLQAVLEDCIIRFGEMKMLVHKAGLYEVLATERFRIDREIAQLGRIFLEPYGYPSSRRRASGRTVVTSGIGV